MKYIIAAILLTLTITTHAENTEVCQRANETDETDAWQSLNILRSTAERWLNLYNEHMGDVYGYRHRTKAREKLTKWQIATMDEERARVQVILRLYEDLKQAFCQTGDIQ